MREKSRTKAGSNSGSKRRALSLSHTATAVEEPQQHQSKPAPSFASAVQTTVEQGTPLPSNQSRIPLSPQQQAVIEWVRAGTGSAFVQARAGSGKTFTLTAAVRQMSGSVALTAFNKKIAEELKYKLSDLPGVRVGTFHSFGFTAWRRVAKNVSVNAQQKDRAMMVAAGVPKPMESAVRRLVSLAKQSVVGLAWAIDDREVWNQIIDHHSILLNAPATTNDEQMTQDLIAYAIRGLHYAREQGRGLIDFDDMLWLPLVEDVATFQNDWVLVDESQDTNVARRMMAAKMLKPRGRALFVGDDRQAIYGFCHPAGTKVLTPAGLRNIENLVVGDLVVVATTAGEVEGWGGERTVKAAHKYHHQGRLIKLQVGSREVEVTPNHKVPVRIGDAQYYTYMMRRAGCYRVGHCQAFTSGRFMLQLRRKTEKADAVWILGGYSTKSAAVKAERQLLQFVKGTTFQGMTDAEIKYLPDDKSNALLLLERHGRMVDFPLLGKGRSVVRISRRGAFVTEACNVINGMKMAYYDDAQRDWRRRGRGRQSFNWTPVRVSSRDYRGEVYGITVQPVNPRAKSHGYARVYPPLYFSGTGCLLVHNSGADASATQEIINRFACHLLPLTVTFRCSKSATKLAQSYVPDITPHESNRDGEVVHVSAPTFIESFIKNRGIHLGDAILCRNTRPLVDLAFRLIRNGIGCHVEGRDIGNQLENLVTRWKVDTVQELFARLVEYRMQETERLIKREAEHLIDMLNDRIETIFILADGLSTVEQLLAKINSLFQDTDAREGRNRVTLSTIHRYKGRESDRVFILGWGKYLPSKFAKQEWELEQERNLAYVAVTRTRDKLYLVDALD